MHPIYKIGTVGTEALDAIDIICASGYSSESMHLCLDEIIAERMPDWGQSDHSNGVAYACSPLVICMHATSRSRQRCHHIIMTLCSVPTVSISVCMVYVFSPVDVGRASSYTIPINSSDPKPKPSGDRTRVSCAQKLSTSYFDH